MMINVWLKRKFKKNKELQTGRRSPASTGDSPLTLLLKSTFSLLTWLPLALCVNSVLEITEVDSELDGGEEKPGVIRSVFEQRCANTL